MAVENRSPPLQAVACTLLVTAVISMLLRAYVRLWLVKNFGVDDWCMVVATISFILFVTCVLGGIHYGTGRHYWDLEDGDTMQALRYWWFCYLWYCITMIASKISIGYFLLRITVRRLDIWIIYSVMVVTVLTGLVFFFVTLFQCTPVSFFWTKVLDDTGGHCVPIDVIIALTYLYSVCSVICDFTFALLPVFLISKLNMDRRTKTVLIPLVVMACVASAAVVVRFAYVKDFKNPDFLYATVDIAIWSTVEQGLAITAGSLATLRPLYRIILSKFGMSSGGPSGLQQSGTLPDSHHGFSNIGASRGSRGLRGPFSLTTFMNRDEESKGAGEADGGIQRHKPETADSKGGSIWGAGPEGAGGSEEELTERLKNGGWDDRHYQVKITSGHSSD